MPRTRRYIFNTLTVVSLLLMLATVGLWVDSVWYACGISHTSKGRGLAADSRRHRVLVLMAKPIGGPCMGWYGSHTSLKNQPVISDSLFHAQFLGFGLRWQRTHPLIGVATIIIVPHWFLALAFAILPAIWFVKWRRRRNLPDNACPTCTYDLTGNQTGVCPECGTSIGTEAQA